VGIGGFMKGFQHFTKIVLLLCTGILGVSIHGYSLTPDEMVRKMDNHFTLGNNFEVTIRVESYLNREFKGLTVMKGEISQGTMATFIFLEPSNMKERKLIVKGDDMWFIFPNVKKPIRITASQKLAGGISYSDFARIRYADDYTARRIGEEPVAGLNPDGKNSETDTPCVILELTTKDKRKNYSKIIVWLDEQSCLPVKADFFAPSGKKMMTAFYAATKEWNGKIIVTKLFLFDQINTTRYFSIEYMDIIQTNITNRSENQSNE
jgi:outer membrane lipoprotein-sorting protein